MENNNTTPQSASSTKEPNISEDSNLKSNNTPSNANPNQLFPKGNLLMMLGCLALIIIGFILMTGGSSSIEEGFNPDIFSTRRIVVGPTIAFLGFLLMAFAIIINPKKKHK